MTDEEMANEYARLNARQYLHNDGSDFCTSEEEVKQAFLTGLKAGRPKWHNLRKNPDDLPKRDERFDTKVSVPVFSSKGNFVVYYFETKEWYCNGQKEEVVAWCEIPKFEEGV